MAGDINSGRAVAGNETKIRDGQDIGHEHTAAGKDDDEAGDAPDALGHAESLGAARRPAGTGQGGKTEGENEQGEAELKPHPAEFRAQPHRRRMGENHKAESNHRGRAKKRKTREPGQVGGPKFHAVWLSSNRFKISPAATPDNRRLRRLSALSRLARRLPAASRNSA